LAELAPVGVDDRARARLDAVPLEERAVVVAREEARLLALCAACGGEAGAFRLGARLLLALPAERERDALEQARVEAREHVRLVLVRVRTAREQYAASMLRDARVVAGREPLRACALREREQLGEAEAAVAAHARVRRLPARVALDGRADDLAAENRPERVRERVDRERLPGDRGRLEQRDAGKRAVQPGCIRFDDPVAVDAQTSGGPFAVAARVSERLGHAGEGSASPDTREP